jgi:hypothetical protein
MSSEYHLIKGSLDAQGKPNVIDLLVGKYCYSRPCLSPPVA